MHMEFTAFISEDEPNKMVEWPIEDAIVVAVSEKYNLPARTVSETQEIL